MRRLLLIGAAAPLVAFGAAVPAATATTEAAAPEQERCHPTGRHAPVCPAAAPLDTASFVDPSARVSRPDGVLLGHRVYVGPFAELLAADTAPITIDEESNAQDNVRILGSADLLEEAQRFHQSEDESPAASGPRAAPGVLIGRRVILAHGASVIGPAAVGVGGGSISQDPEQTQNAFLSFGAQVDGAVLEQNTVVSALGRVGPGVTLHSGTVVLPGKNVVTQTQADDPAEGKVRRITEADVAFNRAVLEVNRGFAREYTRLFREDPLAVRGVSVDPGHAPHNPDRDLPTFAGRERAVPGFRNRVIGDVRLADSFGQFNRRSGQRISLRADEGEPFVVGHVEDMADDVIFHALEESDLHLGDGITYGRGAIVHGGGRAVAGRPDEPTRVGDGVRLGDESVVFRSTVGDGAVIGRRSAVVGTDLPPGTQVPERTVVLNGSRFGAVEW